MPKKKKAQQELPEAAPVPAKKAKPAKKPKPQKEFSPFPALFAMWFTLFLGWASIVGVDMYQTYQHNVFAYEQAVRAQEQRARALEENRDKWDLIGAKKQQGQAVSTTTAPEAPSASPEPTQTPETPPAVPEEPSPAPAPAQATEPSQKPQETQAKAPSTPSTPASNQTPAQAKTQETQPEEKPSNSGSGQQPPGVTIAPSEGQKSDTGNGSNQDKTSNSGGNSGTAKSISGTPGDAIVYVSNSANKIHSMPDCSNMKNYREMAKSEADANQYEYCKNCWT